MTPLEHDLYLEQGSSFSEEFNLFNDDGTPLDLTNATITATFARSYSNVSTKYNFDIIKDESVVNRFVISRPMVEQDTPPGRYWWNGIVTINTVSMKFVKGIVNVNAGVFNGN